MNDWVFVKTGIEGECELFGVNIFEYVWNNTGQKVSVLDPVYGQTHEMTVYTATINDRTVTFAAGEFSNCIYGFYVNEKE